MVIKPIFEPLRHKVMPLTCVRKVRNRWNNETKVPYDWDKFNKQEYK